MGRYSRDMPDSGGTLRFVFLTSQEILRVPDGLEAEGTGETVYLARSVPGNIVGEGTTRDEAIEALKRLLRPALRRSASGDDWMREAWRRIDARYERPDLDIWVAAWRSPSEPSRDGRIQFFAVTERSSSRPRGIGPRCAPPCA